MSECTFLFDIYVKQINLPNEKIADPKKFTAKADFAGVKVAITASRINVSESNGYGQEITAQPNKLREKLEENGMPIDVNYEGKTMGKGTLEFPQKFIDSINEGMSELVHEDSCVLIRSNQEIGFVQVVCRLTIKCVEQQDSEKKEVCRTTQIGADIKPQDIFFLMGMAASCPVPSENCADELEAEPGDVMLALDLDRYRSMNQRVEYLPDDASEPFESPACDKLKRLADEYQGIIENIAKKMEQLSTPIGEHDQLLNFSCGPCNPRPEQEAKSDDQADHNGAQEHVLNQRTIPVPIDSRFDEQQIKNSRFCPICLANMSWVPKFGNCPNCNAKPVPVLEPRHNFQATVADDIMNEYLRKEPSIAENYCVEPCEYAVMLQEDSDNTQDPCAMRCCTCKDEQKCVHCRIRQTWAEIVNSSKPKEEGCQPVEPRSSEDFYIVNEIETQCAPHLIRVFSELRNIYQAKSDKEKLAKLDKLCQEPLFRVRSSETVETKEPEGATKKPWEMEHSYPGVKIGHKDCIQHVPTVPRRHGWAWTSTKEARKYGWRPGAIRKPLEGIMKFFLNQNLKYLSDNGNDNNNENGNQNDDDEEQQLPILNVSKKKGEIYITLRPLAAPGLKVKPQVFRVVKSELALALREIKRKIKDMGIAKCTCHKPLSQCVCRPSIEKMEIEKILSKECERRCMPSCVDKLVLTDTSASEMEYDIEVTPPAGIPRPVRAKGPKTVAHATQTSISDRMELPPKYPYKLSPYERAFDCVTAGRYRGTVLGQPGETVFEDGVFGWQGGGMRGQQPAPQGRKQNTLIWGATPGEPIRRGARFGAGPQHTCGPEGFGAKAWKGLAANILRKMKKSNVNNSE